jgi:hypothetical protein
MKIELISIKPSNKYDKKLMAYFIINDKQKIIHFGQKYASDYLHHHDIKRRNRYIFRHIKDIKTGDPSRAGYLSLYILWNKLTLKESINDYKKRLNIYNKTGKFPIKILGFS